MPASIKKSFFFLKEAHRFNQRCAFFFYAAINSAD